MDNEIRLSFWEILLSPFVSLKKMVTSKEEINDEVLNPNSSDKIEAYLAKKQNEVDGKVTNYGGRGVTKKTKRIEGIEVDRESLGDIKKVPKPIQEKTTSRDHERVD